MKNASKILNDIIDFYGPEKMVPAADLIGLLWEYQHVCCDYCMSLMADSILKKPKTDKAITRRMNSIVKNMKRITNKYEKVLETAEKELKQ